MSNELYRLIAAAGFPNHRVALFFQEFTQIETNDRFVLRDDDAGHDPTLELLA